MIKESVGLFLPVVPNWGSILIVVTSVHGARYSVAVVLESESDFEWSVHSGKVDILSRSDD